MSWILNWTAIGAVLSALFVITVKNPVISVVFLIGVFINVTLYLVTLGLGYLGLVYLIVYIGAIAILFLFVIMMLNLRLVELVDTGKMFTKSLPIALFLTSFLIYLLVEVIPETFHDGGSGILNSFELFNSVLEGEWSTNLSVTQPLNYSFNPSLSEITLVQLSQIESIGHSLYTYGAVWLMITAIILMLAMVGPILLCLRTR